MVNLKHQDKVAEAKGAVKMQQDALYRLQSELEKAQSGKDADHVRKLKNKISHTEEVLNQSKKQLEELDKK